MRIIPAKRCRWEKRKQKEDCPTVDDEWRSDGSFACKTKIPENMGEARERGKYERKDDR